MLPPVGARSRGFVALALALATLAGCAGQTNRPFGVSATGAILTGEHQCATPSSGKLAWQWRELGAQAWSSGAAVQFSCPAGRRSISHVLHGLKPDTSYQYRLLVDLREPCNLSRPSTCSDVYPLDSGGTANGTAYETFTTQPQCDDVQGPSESLSAFVASNSLTVPLPVDPPVR